MSALNIDDLDETEIRAEAGEVYLFQWLSSLEKSLTDATSDQIKSKHSDLERSVVKVLLSPDPFPPPGRPLRNLAARCLILLYKKGETKSLFDTLQLLLRVAGDSKVQDKDVNKVAAFHCIGDLMVVFGSQIMSFMADITSIVLRTFKSSSSSLLRSHALVALRKSLTTAQRALPEGTRRDVLKHMKSGLCDKSFPVQRAVAEVLLAIHASPEGIMTLVDIETIISHCTKCLETADQITRHSLSELVGHLLSSTQKSPRSLAPEASQKGKQGTEDNDDSSLPHGGSDHSKTLLTPGEMLAVLSNQFNKYHISRRIRVGIFDFYSMLLSKLGSTFVESHYALIVGHFMTEIVSNPRAGLTRYDTLSIRHLVEVILRDLIGVRMLSEQGQIGAIQELSRSYLKRWPAMMPGQISPSPSVIDIALRESAGLLRQLGNAPPPVQDAVAEPLVTLLAHPSHTVRVTASYSLRCFCYFAPLRLPRTILSVLELLQRDLSTLLLPTLSPDIPLQSLGHAYGLSALISIIPERPLYVSYDVSAKVLDVSIQLLKRASDHDVNIAKVEIEVAWTSIASLMSLGPNFVRPHLPQLLVLWRNALPKPVGRDLSGSAGRTVAEWAFLLHVRECALGAIFRFLRHNSSTLVTLDVARRIASVLGNALSFANSFISQNADDILIGSLSAPPTGLSLQSREALLRRRVYECFCCLGSSHILDSMQSTLLRSAVSLFASPDGYTGSPVQAAIASSSGTFTSVWQSTDGYAYGVTYIELKDSAGNGLTLDSAITEEDRLNRDAIEMAFDALLRKPVLGAREHDPLSLCEPLLSDAAAQLPEPPPAATSLVDASIELFSRFLPFQDISGGVQIVTQLLDFVRSTKLEKNSGRKGAVFVNANVAVVLALRQASIANSRRAREIFASSQMTALLSSFLKDALADSDPLLRVVASESIGRLASLAGTSFLTSQTKLLVDQVVNNRDPNGRAGCALAFGAIYTHVGGLAAGPLLKTTVNVLMSLSNDPHPLVHYWALNALSRVINSASLAYAPFVSSTLGMLLKVYLSESHECEGGTLLNANTSGDYPSYPVLCQIIDAVITILGPDIQESPRTRTLVLHLVHEFLVEVDETICVEALKCIQHFLMFAPEHVRIPELVDRFRSHLSSPRRPLKLASINALYQLVQQNAVFVSKLGGDRLVEDLFGMLDDDWSVQGVKNVISSWLQQTMVHNPSAWIDLCQRIMARTTASQQVADAATTRGILRDDEGESLNLGDKAGTVKTHPTSRWRTQLFALHCLHNICNTVAQSGREEHLSITAARSLGIPITGLLVSRVPDLIRMAFTASTAYVSEIRLEGLILLRDVIEIFATASDPDYPDALLLEQYQAPITAALTPAFSPDSTPEILASAIKTSAIFVGCGVVKDMNRMGRILKLLTVALDQSKDLGTISLGDIGDLGPNASAMLRISTISAWAKLEVASSRQPYLPLIIKPYHRTLARLWVAALRDYACIRANSEVLYDTSSATLDPSYSSLGKEVLLPYYVESFPVLLQAVATAMGNRDSDILAAINGQDPSAGEQTVADKNESTPFFHVIFGLIFEALTASVDMALPTPDRQTTTAAALQALKYLVQPEYSGHVPMEPTVFGEFLDLCYRLAMTGTIQTQVHLVEMLGSLATCRRPWLDDDSIPGSQQYSLPLVQEHCLRICAYILQHVPSKPHETEGNMTDRINTIRACLSVFCDAVSFSPDATSREDIRGVAILLYSALLKNEYSQTDFVGPTLPSLKTLLEIPPSGGTDRLTSLVHGLLSTCILNVDELCGRCSQIAVKNARNNLLVSVLVLTVVPTTVSISHHIIEQCCHLICQKLMENGELCLTAAYCAKTLVVASLSGNPMLTQCSKLMLHGFIEYMITLILALNEDISELHLSTIGEIWRGLFAICAILTDNQCIQMFDMLLPIIGKFLQHPHSPVLLKTQVQGQLLLLATASPMAFKESVGELDSTVKELLEQALRSAVGEGISSQNVVKPSISLKSF